jgi:hypothetical protein
MIDLIAWVFDLFVVAVGWVFLHYDTGWFE